MHNKESSIPKIKRLLIWLAARIFNLWFSTCRIQIIGRAYHELFIEGDQKCVGATWHRGAIFLVWFFRKAHPMIMFSRSKDGDLLAGFAENLGVVPVRGSSSRGGRKALRQMVAFLNGPGSGKAATVLDGPRGPRCVAKTGMIVLAMKAGVPLLPIMVSARPAITFRKAWDRTMLPLPFSNITVIYTHPFMLPNRLDSEELERVRLRVQKRLNRMMAECDAISGYRDAEASLDPR
jgi:lysophospholipid acyltransferase (LPLAT)-like uncharacterized protein